MVCSEKTKAERTEVTTWWGSGRDAPAALYERAGVYGWPAPHNEGIPQWPELGAFVGKAHAGVYRCKGRLNVSLMWAQFVLRLLRSF